MSTNPPEVIVDKSWSSLIKPFCYVEVYFSEVLKKVCRGEGRRAYCGK